MELRQRHGGGYEGLAETLLASALHVISNTCNKEEADKSIDFLRNREHPAHWLVPVEEDIMERMIQKAVSSNNQMI